MNMLSTNTEKIKALFIIVFIAMSGILGIDIHLASMPVLIHYFNTDQSYIQHSISFYIFGMALSLLISGPISDRYGRKPVVIFGLLLTCITSVVSVFTHTIAHFLVTRLLQGVGAGASCGLARSMSVDIFNRGKQATSFQGYFSAVVGLSPLLGPMLGGYLQHWFGWQANFIFLGGIFLLLFIIFVYFCPETNFHKNKNSGLNKVLLKNYASLFNHPIFLAATLISGIAMAATITYASLSPFIFQLQFHVSVVTYGWLTSSAAFGIILGRMSNGYLIARLGNIGVLRIGISLLFVSSLWLLISILLGWANIPVILLGIFMMLYGQAFISVNTMLIALKPHHDKRGMAGSLFGGFQMLVTSSTSFIVSIFSSEGILLLGMIFLGLSILAYLLFTVLKHGAFYRDQFYTKQLANAADQIK